MTLKQVNAGQFDLSPWPWRCCCRHERHEFHSLGGQRLFTVPCPVDARLVNTLLGAVFSNAARTNRDPQTVAAEVGRMLQ